MEHLDHLFSKYKGQKKLAHGHFKSKYTIYSWLPWFSAYAVNFFDQWKEFLGTTYFIWEQWEWFIWLNLRVFLFDHIKKIVQYKQIKTHGSVLCRPRNRACSNGVSVLTRTTMSRFLCTFVNICELVRLNFWEMFKQASWHQI